MRELINKYYKITEHTKHNFKYVFKSSVETYNHNEHRTIKTTPNTSWTNNNLQITRHLNDAIHYEQVYKSVPYNSGENVKKNRG